MRKATSLLLLLALVLSLAGAGQPARAQSVYVEPDVLSLVAAGDTVPVILTFPGDLLTADQIESVRQLGLGGIRYEALPFIALNLPAEALDRVLEVPELQAIYLNKPLTLYNYNSNRITGNAWQREDFTRGYGFSGHGISVAINDSGIDATHPDLKLYDKTRQNVKLVANGPDGFLLTGTENEIVPNTYVEDVPNTDENVGHGTHVAGIAAGNGAASSGKYAGVAPGAHLIGLGAGLGLFVTNVLGGFDYVITHKDQFNIRVVNNSWGTDGEFDPNHPINRATLKLYKAGVTVVFSASNDGPGPDRMSPYALAPWVIAVAAGVKEGPTAGTLADFSSRGLYNHPTKFPSLTAPGVYLISTRASTGVVAWGLDDDLEIEPQYVPYYTRISGTSMSAPYISGVVAVMQEAARQWGNRYLNPDEVKQILMDAATPMPGYHQFEAGTGYVNVPAALDMVKALMTGQPAGYGAVHHRTYNAKFDGNFTTIPIHGDLGLNDTWTTTFEPPAGSLFSHVWVAWEDDANILSLTVTDPNGKTYSDFFILSTLYGRIVSTTVETPVPGTYTVRVRGYNGLSVPDRLTGYIQTWSGSFTNLNDIADHPARAHIFAAVAFGRMDADKSGNFHPDKRLTRGELAWVLAGAAGIRQRIPASPTFSDVSASLRPYVESVTATGAPLKDLDFTSPPVMLPAGDGRFNPDGHVTRAELARSLVIAMGLEAEAQAQMNTATAFTDDGEIPPALRGYVVVASQRGLMPGYANPTLVEGEPLTYRFEPNSRVTRAGMAVLINRFADAYRPVVNIR